MRVRRTLATVAIVCASAVTAQERSTEEVVFAAALQDVAQELRGAPPVNLRYKSDGLTLPPDAIVVARRTIGGASMGFRSFAGEFFASVIAEDLVNSYGHAGPATQTIEQTTAGPFAVLSLEEFEVDGPLRYDWRRLNHKYPNVRHVVRLSWPVVDRIGTYAVVRYELIGRDRPASVRSSQPWQRASFVQFQKQVDTSWKRGISRIGAIWE